MNTTTCNEVLPLRLLHEGAVTALQSQRLLCLRKLGHFRRHTVVYQIVTALSYTKVTIKWSRKENR